MRYVSSRRMRHLLLALVLACLGAAAPVHARTPYRLDDALEGDPGDGVLRPLAPEQAPVGVPGGADPILVVPDSDVAPTKAAPRPAAWPRLLYVPTLGWLSFAAVWWVGAGRWHDAP